MNIIPPAPTRLKIVLASASPRRRELLQMIAPAFAIAESRNVDESHPNDIKAPDVPVFLSRIKADAYADYIGDSMVLITADTVVICDDKILEKPKDADDARRILSALSGRAHTVVTGVTLRTTTRSISFSETTTVHFSALSDSEIEDYITIFSPMDKAGAYGIQEWIGAIGISGIEGDFYNVMGLPLHHLYRELKNLTI